MRILLVATEAAIGMLPFASSIYNTLSTSSEMDVYALFVSRWNNNYRKHVDKQYSDNVFFLNPSKNRLADLSCKFINYRVIGLIYKIIKENKIDKVHFITGEYTLSVFFKFFHADNNKFYYTVHDLLPHESIKKNLSETLIEKYIKWGNDTNLRTFRNITSSSDTQITSLKKIYPNKKVIRTNFPSLVTQSMKSGSKKVPELKNAFNYILFFGTVDIYKGVDILIDAFRHIKKNDIYLVIAGKGIEYCTTSENNRIIRINRFIDDEECNDLFSNAGCVVYPYISATMSGVLSIAYFYKRPLILSDVDFFTENAAQETLFFKKGNAIELAEKINTLLSSPEQYISEQHYDMRYSKSALINSYKELYK